MGSVNNKLSEDKKLPVNGIMLNVYSETADTMVVLGTRGYERFDNILIFASKKTYRAYTVDKDVLRSLTGIDFIQSMDELRTEIKEEVIGRLGWEDDESVEKMLRLSSLEIQKQKYLSCPEEVIEALSDEIREMAEKAA